VSDEFETIEDIDVSLPDEYGAVSEDVPLVVTHMNSIIGSAFRAANDKRARSHQKALGMSELGGCRRQAGFKVNNTPESNPAGERTDVYADAREAMIGTLIHDTVLPQIAAMSMTAEIEVPVVLQFTDLPAIPGHADMVDEDVLVDLKCTAADTPILMADGRVLRADEIKIEDRVVAFDQIHDQLMISYVEDVRENGDRPTIEITTASGRVLEVTEEHPVWIKLGPDELGEWVRADEVEPGMATTIALTAPTEDAKVERELGADEPWLLGVLAATQFRPEDIESLSIDPVTQAVAADSLALMGAQGAADMWARNPWIDLGTPMIPVEVVLSGARAWTEWLSGFSALAMELSDSGVQWSMADRQMAEQMAAMLAGLGIKVTIDRGTGSDYTLYLSNDNYGLHRLADALWLRSSKDSLLRTMAIELDDVERPDYYDLDLIVQVLRNDEPTRTLAITIAEYHTFVTAGLVTHNTVGTNSARYYQTHGASRRHLWQTHGYAQALIDAGHDIKHVALAYVDRSNGQVVHIHYQPFDKGIVDDIELWWTEVNAAKDPMDLPRDERGPGISKTCDWCPWLKLCWGEDAKPGETGAQSIIVHEASEATEVIEASLIGYTAAALAEKEALEAKKYHRSVLSGVENGRYGAYILAWGKDGTYEVLDADSAEAALAAAGLPIPKIVRSKQGAIRVKRA